MHSVKSETKCMTTIGTVNSDLALRTRRQYEHQLNSLSTADSCFITRTLTCGPDGSCTSSVEAVFRLLGLEFLWEINVQFNEIPVTCVCFLESMTIAHWHVGVILLTSRIV